MLENISLILSLIFFFLNSSPAFTQINEKALPQKELTYQKIIHFDKTDYHLKNIPKGYEGPVPGIQGLYSGDKYLTVWDRENVFVFDLTNYTKIATLSPPLSISDIIEIDGTIYCLSNSARTDNRIYVYDSFDNFKEYIFLSSFKNVTEYKAFLNEFRNDDQQRRRRRKPPSLTASRSLRGKHIRTLSVSAGKIFVDIEGNYLSFTDDFNVESEDRLFYLFLNKDITQKEQLYLLSSEKLISSHNKNITDKNETSYEITLIDINDKKTLKKDFIIPTKNDTFNFVGCFPKILIEKQLYLECSWENLIDKDYYGKSLLVLNLENNEIVNLKLPDRLKNLKIQTNSTKYISFSNSSAYLISYNSDLSFDILKVQLN